MHPPHTEAIGRSYDRAHVKIPQGILTGNLKAHIVAIERGDNLLMTTTFEMVEEVARVRLRQVAAHQSRAQCLLALVLAVVRPHRPSQVLYLSLAHCTELQ